MSNVLSSFYLNTISLLIIGNFINVHCSHSLPFPPRVTLFTFCLEREREKEREREREREREIHHAKFVFSYTHRNMVKLTVTISLKIAKSFPIPLSHWKSHHLWRSISYSIFITIFRLSSKAPYLHCFYFDLFVQWKRLSQQPSMSLILNYAKKLPCPPKLAASGITDLYMNLQSF